MPRKIVFPVSKGCPEDKAEKKVDPSPLNQGAQVFEVEIFNKLVRDDVNLGEHHLQYDEEWSENRYVEVKAKSSRSVRRKLGSR